MRPGHLFPIAPVLVLMCQLQALWAIARGALSAYDPVAGSFLGPLSVGTIHCILGAPHKTYQFGNGLTQLSNHRNHFSGF